MPWPLTLEMTMTPTAYRNFLEGVFKSLRDKKRRSTDQCDPVPYRTQEDGDNHPMSPKYQAKHREAQAARDQRREEQASRRRQEENDRFASETAAKALILGW
jgi:hypothetical protein